MATDKTAADDSVKRRFTVAKVYTPANGFVKVIFYESARFYKMSSSHKKFKTWLAILKTAQKKGTPLMVSFFKNNDEEIIAVEKL